MKRHDITDSKTSFTLSRPTGLDSEPLSYVEPIFKALQQAQHRTGRFKFYGYLAAVYRIFKEWKDLGISKRMARHVARRLMTPRRKGASPARTLIDATFPALDPKQKSRWSRALEFAALMKTTPENLPKLFKNHSGIAGCARRAAKQNPKRETDRNDWV
jgi:hypothetical protein